MGQSCMPGLGLIDKHSHRLGVGKPVLYLAPEKANKGKRPEADTVEVEDP